MYAPGIGAPDGAIIGYPGGGTWNGNGGPPAGPGYPAGGSPGCWLIGGGPPAPAPEVGDVWATEGGDGPERGPEWL